MVRAPAVTRNRTEQPPNLFSIILYQALSGSAPDPHFLLQIGPFAEFLLMILKRKHNFCCCKNAKTKIQY